MEYSISENEKFAAVALVDARRVALSEPVDIGGGLWISTASPMKVDDVWRGWIGTIHSDEIERANLWISAKWRSATPAVINDEDNNLRNEVWYTFVGLLLVGPPSYERGYLLNGANEYGVPRLRGYDTITRYLPSRERRDFVISKRHVMRAQRARAGLRVMFASSEYMRLRRGIRVFIDGMSQILSEARLHQFVRSVEAVVKPPFGSSAKIFAERCRVFTGTNPVVQDVLKECYLLRSAEEHLRDVLDMLKGHPADHRDLIFYRRVIQSEDLARHILGRILTNPGLRPNFRDASLDNFWGLPLKTQQGIWSATVNLT